MDVSNRFFALHLAMTPGVGGKTITRVLTRNHLLGRDPAGFFGLSQESLVEEYRLKTSVAARLSKPSASELDLTLKLQDRLDKLGVTLVTSSDGHFPQRIEAFDPDPPGLLFLYGNTNLLAGKTFCVLSSRNSPPAALSQIEKLTEQGVLGSEILVTGHDRPEYQRSALVPLRWGSPRVLCLDRGLFPALGEQLIDEPFRAARLWRYQFDPKTDLVVSCFRPDAVFAGVKNQVRDRLVAALSLRQDYVIVSEGGNMEKNVRMGLLAGREVRVSDLSLNYRQMRDMGATVIKA